MNAKALLASGMIAAGAALVAAPWALGQRIEKDFRQGLEKAGGATPGVPVQLSLLSYERGYYSSTARTRFEIVPEPGEEGEDSKPKEPVTLELDHRIDHGLGLTGIHYARVTTTLAPEQFQGSMLAGFFGQAQPLTLVTTVDFGGNVQGRLQSPAARQKLAGEMGDADIAWQGLSGSFRLDAEGQAGDFDMDMPGFEIQGGMGSARLKSLVLRARMHRGTESGLWLGDSSAQLAQAEAQMLGSGFAVEGFNILGEASEANGLVRSSAAWQGRRIVFGADTISDFSLRVTLSNLDAATLKAYEDGLEEPLDSASAEQTRQQMLAAQELLAKHLPQLLSKKPELTIEQSGFKFNGAAVDLGGKLRYAGDAQGPFSMADVAGEAHVVLPGQLLSGVMRKRMEKQAQMQAMMSEGESVDASAMAEEGSRQMIDGLVTQGLLMVEADGRYRSDFKLAQGAVTINGLPFQGLPSGTQDESDDLIEEGSEPVY